MNALSKYLTDTLIGVEELCKCGVMPMLSPYAPYANIVTWPTSEYLLTVYNEANKILSKYNIPLDQYVKM